MGASDADLIRGVLVAAIRGIAVTKLGFDKTDGNIREYLFEEEQPEDRALFFAADVGGTKLNRCWAVQVYEAESFGGSVSNSSYADRFYSIEIEGYYGFHGDNPTNLMMTHARKIREAILGLNLDLSGTVGRITEISEFRPLFQDIPNVETPMAVGKMIINGEKYRPSY